MLAISFPRLLAFIALSFTNALATLEAGFGVVHPGGGRREVLLSFSILDCAQLVVVDYGQGGRDIGSIVSIVGILLESFPNMAIILPACRLMLVSFLRHDLIHMEEMLHLNYPG